MKRIFLFVVPLVLAAMSLTFSCNDEIGGDVSGRIIGNVADKTTGEPVPVVNVQLSPGGKSAVTGSDGNYQFMDLEAGSYTLKVEKVGYEPESKTVTVSAGNITEVNFTIERIPAVVTVDRDTLDFGDGSDVNALSFNIVNAGYEDLEWSIEYDCPWIKEIKNSEGILEHGKTQSIVVFIDRTKLSAGENKTIVVVRSSNGSSDLVVTALGVTNSDVVLNTLEVKNIAASSATLRGEIINPGSPKYTERGFVYSLTERPTKETAIDVLSSKVSDEDVFSTGVSGLDLGVKYYVRAYAESDRGIFYSANQVSFVTSENTGGEDEPDDPDNPGWDDNSDNPGGDTPSGTITPGDDRIIAELVSCKRSGTTVTIEYTLRNDGLGDIGCFYMATSDDNYSWYSKIYDEEYNWYKDATYTFNEETSSSYNIREPFPEKVKISGNIVIKNFAETSSYVNIEMKVDTDVNGGDAELTDETILFEDIYVEGAVEGDVDDTDGNDYSSASIDVGDDRISAVITSCRRSGTTITFEYYLRNNGLGDVGCFYVATSDDDYSTYSKIYDEEYNYYKEATYTFNKETSSSYNIREPFPDKVKVHGKIVIKNFAETSDYINIEMKVDTDVYGGDAELVGEYINFENVPVY